ncbi:MAG: glucokinase [Candidatus Eiseniibacteriota bacterium]
MDAASPYADSPPWGGGFLTRVILAADIGGTKVHLALFERRGDRFEKAREAVLATASIASPAEAIAAFARAGPGRVAAVGLGVAGPVVDGRVQGTNLPWVVSGEEVARAVGAKVRLLNDLEASAHGIAALVPDEVATIQAGRPARANRALVSPGTGLGESILRLDGERWLPVGSEGGHADFAARTDEEIELMRHLRSHWGRVSVERVVSGPGLVAVFSWLRGTGRAPDDSGLPAGDPDAASVTQGALEGRSRLCADALRIWTAAFGAEAGNVALRGFALGGVYLGGGIAPRILAALRAGPFLEALRSKTPFEERLREIPVHVILTPETVLRGALAAAAETVQAGT